MAQHAFDQAIALQLQADGSFLGHTSPAYANMVGPFGGITAAIALNAVLQHPQRLGEPISLTVNFAGPVGKGPITARARPARTNRSTQHWWVELLQTDADGTEHVRFQRNYQGLPVIGGDFVVQSRNGKVGKVSQTLKTSARPGLAVYSVTGDKITSGLWVGWAMAVQMTRPGFMVLCGSSAVLIARIRPRATGSLYSGSLSALRRLTWVYWVITGWMTPAPISVAFWTR